jgi:hypothetical protein
MLSETDEQAPASLPIWLSIPIILLCLLCGGWIIHWYVMTDPISHEAKLLGDAPVQTQWRQGRPGGAGFANRGPVQRRTVQLDQANGNMLIRTEKARVTLTVANDKATLRNVAYISYGFLPTDAAATLQKAKTLYPDQKRTEALKLDVHQVGRLRTLSGNYPPMAISPEDRKALVTAADGYIANAKNRGALEITLLQQLDDISDRSINATKQAAVDRAAEINKIITPEMWKQDAAGGAGK